MLSLSDAYACFCEFLDRFLLRLFSDDEFTALQWSFLKFKLLLLFHDPALATFLGKEPRSKLAAERLSPKRLGGRRRVRAVGVSAEEQHVTPELYVTPWFLTLFASKVELGVLLALWDKYILEDDASFFCFLALALLIFNRSRILKTEVSQLPETLCRLSIHSTEQLDFVGVSLLPHCAPRSSVADRGREAGDLRLLFCPQTWRLARVLKAQTPPSLVREIAEAKVSSVAVEKQIVAPRPLPARCLHFDHVEFIRRRPGRCLCVSWRQRPCFTSARPKSSSRLFVLPFSNWGSAEASAAEES